MTSVSTPAARCVAASTVHDQILAVLTAWGMARDLAAQSAEAMAAADLHGIDSHGIATLIYYEGLIQSGAINLSPEIRVVAETPATALIDADGALGHGVARRAMTLACDKADALGIGAVAVLRSDHYGAAGTYVAQAADRGLIGLCVSNGFTRCVVPAGGRTPMFSTNPIAFGAPGRRNRPFMFDIATSTAAIGKVNLAWLAGKELPAGWVVDETGAPVTDAARARELVYAARAGGLTPLGGTAEMGAHKGYGIIAMIEILAAVLPGAMVAPLQHLRPRDGTRTDTGHFFLAINPAAFRPAEEFRNDLDDMMDALRATPSANPANPVQVPGDREWATRVQREITGIPLGSKLIGQIEAIAERAGAPFLLNAEGTKAAAGSANVAATDIRRSAQCRKDRIG